MRTIRWAIGTGLLPAAVIGGTLALMLSWRSRLPERLPNQGGVGDRPVSTTIGADTLAVVLIGVAVAAWLAGLAVLVLASRVGGTAGHWLRAATQVGVNALVAAVTTILLMVLGAALDAATATDVRISWGHFTAVLMVPMVAAAVFGGLGLLLAGRERPAGVRPPGGPASPVSTPAAAAGTTRPAYGSQERLLWWESRPLRPVLWVALVLALNGVLLTAVLVPLVGMTGWAGLAPVVSAVALVPFARYRLAIDNDAVRVSMGLIRHRVPMSEITAAGPAHLPASTWLARSILRGAAAGELPLLPGPVLDLRLADGTHRMVTCRDIATAVSVVNTLRARQARA